MKKLFLAVIAWIKSHVWQSVVIGVVTVGAIATAITLPIVLSKSNEPDPVQQEIEPEPEPEPGPGPSPSPTYYTVSAADTVNGTLELSESGEFMVGKEITALATPSEGYKLKEITINGEVKSTSTPYRFTVTEALADEEYKIVVGATFEKEEILLTGITISGYNSLHEGDTIELEAIPIPLDASFNPGLIDWHVLEGPEYVSLSSTTGSKISVTGVYEGEAKIRAVYNGGQLYSNEHTILINAY